MPSAARPRPRGHFHIHSSAEGQSAFATRLESSVACRKARGRRGVGWVPRHHKRTVLCAAALLLRGPSLPLHHRPHHLAWPCAPVHPVHPRQPHQELRGCNSGLFHDSQPVSWQSESQTVLLIATTRPRDDRSGMPPGARHSPTYRWVGHNCKGHDTGCGGNSLPRLVCPQLSWAWLSLRSQTLLPRSL